MKTLIGLGQVRAASENAAVLAALMLSLVGQTTPANAAPRVLLATPLNGATYPTPATITLSAEVSDADGSVTNVEFFTGTTRLHQDATAPYSYVWTTSTLGTNTLTARATDNLGLSSTSSPVRVVINEDRTRRVIYSTAFESAEGYECISLAGQNGWTDAGSGLNGVMAGVFPGQGNSAFVGGSATGSDSLFLWRPINYTPEAALPLIKFSVLMRILDSTNGKYDDFLWELYNSQVSRLFSLLFDNSSMHVYYRLEGDAPYVDTLKTFANANTYQLLVSLDVQSNRWNATLDGVTLVSQLPITTSNSVVDIGDFDAVWFIYEETAPGNNSLVFDNYQISAEARPGARSSISVLGPPAGGQITIRVQGSPDLSYTLQASSNLSAWTDRQTNYANSLGIVDFTEPVANHVPRSFYRARQNP